MARNLWKREELIIALNLYWKIPYNKISGSSNSKIKEMAKVLSRTPAALAYKLMNFTSLDPERRKMGKKGKSAASKLDAAIWNEYFNKWEALAHDSYKLFNKFKNNGKNETSQEQKTPEKGLEKRRLVKTRVNQSDFRERILASYNEKCCITGIDIPSLLVASHIIPWSKNEEERLNPSNGLCLNAIHDKAFDRGLLTITSKYKVQISNQILKKMRNSPYNKFFTSYHQATIILPDRYLPKKEFLLWHNQNVFQQ